MLTYEECLEMCDLTPDEVAAIAEHEHLDEMIAMAKGHYLVEHQGVLKIRKMILDDIAQAERRGDKAHATVLRGVLHHFMQEHRV